MKLLILSFVLTSEAFAYRPTVESLFRNNNNPEIEKPSTTLVVELKEDDSKVKNKLKFYMTESPSGTEMFQVVMSSSGAVLKTTQVNRLETSVSEVTDEQSLFYSVLNVLLRNNSEVIIKALKSKGVDVAYNKELVNNDKKILLEKYRTFLERKKKNPDYKDEYSPLYSKNDATKKEIMKLYNESYYQQAEKAQLVKVSGKTMWKILKDGFVALFDHSTRQLEKLSYSKGDAKIELSFQGYFKVDGVHEIPKFIYINLDGDKYLLETKEYRTMEQSGFQTQKMSYNKQSPEGASVDLPKFLIK